MRHARACNLCSKQYIKVVCKSRKVRNPNNLADKIIILEHCVSKFRAEKNWEIP